MPEVYKIFQQISGYHIIYLVIFTIFLSIGYGKSLIGQRLNIYISSFN